MDEEFDSNDIQEPGLSSNNFNRFQRNTNPHKEVRKSNKEDRIGQERVKVINKARQLLKDSNSI